MNRPSAEVEDKDPKTSQNLDDNTPSNGARRKTYKKGKKCELLSTMSMILKETCKMSKDQNKFLQKIENNAAMIEP